MPDVGRDPMRWLRAYDGVERRGRGIVFERRVDAIACVGLARCVTIRRMARLAVSLVAIVTLLSCKHKSGSDPDEAMQRDVVGFRFGMSPTESDAHCESVGAKYPSVDKVDGFTVRTCEHVLILPGIRTSVYLHFCDADTVLCEITLASTSSSDAKMLFNKLRPELSRSYGPPTNTTATNAVADFADGCPSSSARLRWTWWWGTPPAATARILFVTECDGATQSTSIFYDDARGVTEQTKIAKKSGVVK